MGSVFSGTDPVGRAEALIAAGRAEEAVSQLRAALAIGRGGLLARMTLVKALIASADGAAALEEAREAVSRYPEMAVPAMVLGEALLHVGALPAAIAELRRALHLDPTLEAAELLIARAWLEAGEAEEPLKLLAARPVTPDTDALIARARAIQAAPRSDPGYIRHLFDQFSADYDRRMIGQLAYAGPEILLELADLVMPGRTKLSVLDLGCGTGLAGLAFRSRAAHLDGIDLSPAMVEKARARGIYESLAVGDIETAIRGCFDLVLAADTLVYLGDLTRLISEISAHLSPNGYFLFTAEAKDGSGFELGPKRRWRHSEAYVRERAAAAGLAVAGLVSATSRTEKGRPVPGLAVALSR